MRIDEFIAKTGARYVYHFTSTANLPSIREHGLLSDREMRFRGIKPTARGGDEASIKDDRDKKLNHDIHLCFMSDHPMERKARWRLGTTRFLKVEVSVLGREGVRGCAGLANRGCAYVMDIEDILDRIDLNTLYGGLGGTCVKEPWARYNKARKAEILVPEHIPVSMIVNLG
ncbi:MAG: DarT ssDNA thymidine ADP-ribosyltransferase family protein [Thermoleophilia bacterium]